MDIIAMHLVFVEVEMDFFFIGFISLFQQVDMILQKKKTEKRIQHEHYLT